MLKNKLQMKRH